MKRIFLLWIFSLVIFSVNAQRLELGLRFSPGFAYNRAIDKDIKDSIEVAATGVGLRFIAGPEINFFFGDNMALTTGIWYATKRSGIALSKKGVGEIVREIWNIQYIQIPATAKLYTNDIMVDMKVYFQLGATFDFKLSQKPNEVPLKNFIEKFSIFDTSVMVGSGLEYQLGATTYAFGGISYFRGLLNSLGKQYGTVDNFNLQDLDVKLGNDMITLDVGLRF